MCVVKLKLADKTSSILGEESCGRIVVESKISDLRDVECRMQRETEGTRTSKSKKSKVSLSPPSRESTLAVVR